MKKFVLFVLCALCLCATNVAAQEQVPLLSVSRISLGVGVERAWTFESFDVGTQVGEEWYVKVPFAYTLPTAIPTAITGRVEKALTSSNVGLRLGAQVVLFRQGAWVGGQ